MKTATVGEVSEALSFKTPRQFLKEWQRAGYRILRPSPNKHVVFVADVARSLSDRGGLSYLALDIAGPLNRWTTRP